MPAPWLQPPDVLGAMRGGASLGLQLRNQDLIEQEAADRLRQNQNAMLLRAMESRQTHREHAAEAAARLSEAAALHAAQAGFKEQAQQQWQTAQALRERHQDFLERSAAVKSGEKDFSPEVTQLGGANVVFNRQTGHFQIVPKEKPDPFEVMNARAGIQEKNHQLAEFDRQIFQLEKMKIGTTDKDQIALIEQKLQDLNNQKQVMSLGGQIGIKTLLPDLGASPSPLPGENDMAAYLGMTPAAPAMPLPAMPATPPENFGPTSLAEVEALSAAARNPSAPATPKAVSQGKRWKLTEQGIVPIEEEGDTDPEEP